MKQTEYMKGWSHAGWLLVIMTAIMFLFFIFVGECSAQIQTQHLSVIAKKNSGGGVVAYQDDVLECTSAGTAYISSTVASGTFEFDIYHGTANTSYVYILHPEATFPNSSGSIIVYPKNTESLKALRNGAAICETASSYISADTWYTIKVVIPASFGDHEFYLDDVLWVEATGSNPYSATSEYSSTYFGLNLGAGDKIRNVKINSSSYTNLEDFVGTGTGTYTFTDN